MGPTYSGIYLNFSQKTANFNKLTLVSKSSPEIKKLQAERRTLTDASLAKVFSLYSFTRFDGKEVSLKEIIHQHQDRLPPTGTGDCCAPKLLMWAAHLDLRPFAMAEFFWGDGGKSGRAHGVFYAPCAEKCGPILGFLLCGL